MVRFVIWGAGGRGKVAAKIFGIDRIISFIDLDPDKIGTDLFGRQIIDFQMYKKKYTEYAILISLAAEAEVVRFLKEENIFFLSYNECPPELMGYGWNRAQEYVKKHEVTYKKAAVYGHTLYSVLVYEFLEKNGHECVGLIHNSSLTEKELYLFRKMFPNIKEKDIDDIDSETVILQTVSNYACNHELHKKNIKNIFDWKNLVPEYFNAKIAEKKNKYLGRRCFIVATGPSLTFEDLETLHKHNEFCISLNTIFCSFQNTAWKPDQYVVVDVDVINKFNDEIRKMDIKEKFIADASIDFDYKSLTNEFYIYHSICTKYTLEQGLISDDFATYAYNTGTVTAVALQLAMYEGFSEIYLLGCDCSYLQTGLKHANEPKEMQVREYGVMESTIEMLEHHVNAYQKIRVYADKKNIKIFNATRGGYLEVFKRKNFDDIFKNA